MKNDGNDDDSSAPSQPHWRRYYAWKSEIRWKKIQPKPPWAHIFVKTKTNSAHPLSLKRDKESETKNTEIHQHNIDKKPFLGYDKRIWNYEQFCYTTHIPSDIKQRILKEIERASEASTKLFLPHIWTKNHLYYYSKSNTHKKEYAIAATKRNES